MQFKAFITSIAFILSFSADAFAGDEIRLKKPTKDNWHAITTKIINQENLEYVAFDSGYTTAYFYFPSSQKAVSERPNTFSGWIQTEYFEPQFDDFYGAYYRSKREQYFVSCEDEETSIRLISYFKGNLRSGDILGTVNISRREAIENLSPAAPKTLASSLAESICTNSRSNVDFAAQYRAEDCDLTRSENQCVYDWIE